MRAAALILTDNKIIFIAFFFKVNVKEVAKNFHAGYSMFGND
jgi:hypothetical protein